MHTNPPHDQQTFYMMPRWRRVFLLLPFMMAMFYLVVGLLSTILIRIQFEDYSPFPFGYLILTIAALTAFCCLISYPIMYWSRKRIHHTITPAGIEFHALDYRIYTPWQNITGVERMKIGIYNPPSLLLQVPAIDDSIENGKKRNIATIQRGWLVKKNKVLPASLPLIFTVPNRDWRVSELGTAIKHYAPQAIDPELDCPPDQQALRRAINTKLRFILISYIITMILILIPLQFASLPTLSILATLLVCYWLLIPCLLIFYVRKKQHMRGNNTIIPVLLLCILMLCTSVFHLAFLSSWLRNPLEALINPHYVTSILSLFTLIPSLPFICNLLLKYLAAKEIQQLVSLEILQK